MPVLYIDESKARDFILVGVLVKDKDTIALRKQIKTLLLAGQRSVHFQNEGFRRRKLLIDKFLNLRTFCVSVRVKGAVDSSARSRAIEKIIQWAGSSGISKLCFELDETSLKSDIRTLNEVTYSKSIRGVITWDHIERHQEPLLWIPDAVAWCLNRGGDWARMIRPMIIESIEC